MTYIFQSVIKSSQLLVAFLFSIYIVKFLSIEELGIYGLILSISRVIPIILGIGFISEFQRNYKYLSEDIGNNYLANHFLWIFLIYFFLGFFLYLILKSSIEFMENYFIFLFLVVITEHYIYDFIQYNFIRNKALQSTVINFFHIFLRSVPFMIFAFFFESLISFKNILIFWFIFNFFLLFILFFYFFKKFTNFKLDIFIHIKMFKNIRLLYTNNLLNILRAELPLYFIGLLSNETLLGVYVFFNNIFNSFSNFMNYTFIIEKQQSIIDFLFQKRLDEANYLKKESLKLIFFIYFIFFLGFIFFINYFGNLIDPNLLIYDYISYFLLIIISINILQSFQLIPFVYKKDFFIFLVNISSIFFLIINIKILNLLYGNVGLLFSVLNLSLFHFLLFYFYERKIIQIEIKNIL